MKSQRTQLLYKHKTDVLGPMGKCTFLANQNFSLYENNYESFGISHCSYAASSGYGAYNFLFSFVIISKTWARVVVKIL